MPRTLKEALKHRRSCYSIENSTPICDKEIEELIAFAVENIPSAFNSQTTRIVLLLGENHSKLWNIVKTTLRKIVPKEAFGTTEQKINSFGAGYGTVLFFEEQKEVVALQQNFPTYADRFPVWSEHTSAMHQLAIWTLLEENGLGASLQHYNPLIDDQVKEQWNLPGSWKLIAQMPFGAITAEPAAKTHKPIGERFLIFK